MDFPEHMYANTPQNQPKLILIADDDPVMRIAIETVVRKQGYRYHSADSAARAQELIKEHHFHLVVTDMRMERPDAGMDVIRAVIQRDAATPVLVLTGYVSGGDAVEAMRAGAYDYLSKPIDVIELEHAIAGALYNPREALQDVTLEESWGADPFADIIGTDPALMEVLHMIRRSSDTNATIMIQGETGTGKELFAQAIHRTSPRRERMFVSVNCGALPEGLIESELFGHEKGAFTDAHKQRPGRFRMANGGTLFLDEIGDMAALAQVKLLRTLQEGTVQPVGSDKPVNVDVRVIAATHQNLEQSITSGKFRKDLYYRLNVINLDIPPLRARPGDIVPLALHFIRKTNQRQNRRVLGLDIAAQELLLRYSWPGNIRELENIMERVVILSRDGLLSPADFPRRLREYRREDDSEEMRAGIRTSPAIKRDALVHDPVPGRMTEPESLDGPLTEPAPPETLASPEGPSTSLPEDGFDMRHHIQRMEEQYIKQALAKSKGNRSEAARLLSMKRTTLVERLKRMGVDD